MPERIVIVGAGQAACQTVVSLRRGGYAGSLVMFGEEPWLPYHRPPLSKGFLRAEVDTDRLPIRASAFFDSHEVDCRLGTRVEALDVDAATVQTADGTRHRYDRLLLATGGRARELPMMRAACAAGVHTLRNIDDAQRLRDALRPGLRVVIIGGGFIGLETAAALRSLECAVTVIEATERVLSRVVPAPVSSFYAAEHERHGVDIVTGVAVTSIEGADAVTAVRAGEQRWPADLVLVSVGLLPNDELARTAGLECAGGIVVDTHCRTSDARVFAAGDVALRRPAPDADGVRLESVHNAVWQGKCVAAAMLGAEPVAAEVPWFWSDQFGLKLQMAGLPAPDDSWLVRGDADAAPFSLFSHADGVVTSSVSINAPRDFMAAKKLIAAGTACDLATLRDATTPL